MIFFAYFGVEQNVVKHYKYLKLMGRRFNFLVLYADGMFLRAAIWLITWDKFSHFDLRDLTATSMFGHHNSGLSVKAHIDRLFNGFDVHAYSLSETSIVKEDKSMRTRCPRDELERD